jgi:PLP dependent protein
MTTVESLIAGNLAQIRERIEAACRRTGRSASDVLLVAVTKSARIEWIEALISLGVGALGESRPQQLVDRAERIATPVQWHLIGHLQRNKARKVLPVAAWLHSIDSLQLAIRIDALAAELSLRPGLLLEVNVSGEASKDGFSSEQLKADWPEVCRLSHVEIRGLMTMAPLFEDPEQARPTFRRLRELRDRLAGLPGSPKLDQLSMGMSGDFEAAIEEGATMIRVGTSLFEGLAAQS